MEAKLTPAEYAKTISRHCPMCLGTKIVIPDVRFSLCVCMACGAEWFEEYSVVGYLHLRQGNRHLKEEK